MTTQSSRIEDALAPDGFIDFYTVLDVSPTAPMEELRECINGLYQSAQTNRDHRVPQQKREAQLLIELMPQARLILLDARRRMRYDAYRDAVSMQTPRMNPTEFFNNLTRDKEVKTQTDILTVTNLSRLRAPHTGRSQTVKEATPDDIENTLNLEREAARNDDLMLPSHATVASPPPIIVAEVETEAVVSSAPVASTAPISDTHRFSLSSFLGGGIVLIGMVACLSLFADVPLFLAGPLSLVCAGVVAYVFSLSGEVVETV